MRPDGSCNKDILFYKIVSDDDFDTFQDDVLRVSDNLRDSVYNIASSLLSGRILP